MGGASTGLWDCFGSNRDESLRMAVLENKSSNHDTRLWVAAQLGFESNRDVSSRKTFRLVNMSSRCNWE